MKTTRSLIRAVCLAFCSALLAGFFLSEPAAAQNIERGNASLLFESASAQAQDKDGFLLFLQEAPSREQIRKLNELGVDLTLDSWIPPSSTGEPGFLYVRIPSSKESSVGGLPFVVDYQDASAVETEYQEDQAIRDKRVAKSARLDPYQYRGTEDAVLKLHAIYRVRSSEAAKQWASERDWSVEDGKVELVIESETSTPVPAQQIRSLGGTVEKTTSQGDRVVWLPLDSLKAAASSLGEKYRVRKPLTPHPDAIDSEAPQKTRGDHYHEDGLKGDDATVGVIDTGFDDISSADLPSGTTTIDCTGSSCTTSSLGGSSSDHGTAAAEMVADMAPEATFRIYKIGNSTDLQDAVNDGLSNGVNVFTHSLSWYNTGWHDNTGRPATVANNASGNGALFFTSAGNSANRHWQGAFSDGDGDDFLEWNGGGDELNRFTLSSGEDESIRLQWNTDGSDTDNYTLRVYDDSDADPGDLVDSSTDPGEDDEEIDITNSSGSSQNYWILVERISGDGNLEMFLLDNNLERATARSSTTSPSNATGSNVISNAAVDEDNFDDPSPSIESFSSRGPTNDGNQAPQITGPTNTSTSASAISGGTFGGTSAATPNAAGAAALLWDLRAESNDASAPNVREPLLNTALDERDWGSGGVDQTFGYGGVILPKALEVYLLVDLSGSFTDDLPTFKSAAPTLMSNIRDDNPNSRFGLGSYEDFSIDPFGSASAGDVAYRQDIDMTFDDGAVESVINGLSTRSGGDRPQSQLPALFQAATGAGRDLSDEGEPQASIPPSQEASFRQRDGSDEVTKVFVLWTDASFHRPGDTGDIPYPGPSFSETVNAIQALDPPRVVGIASGGGGRSDLEKMAEATGAVAPEGGVDCDGDGTTDIAEGEPLVCDVGSGGSGIAEAIESAVKAAEEAGNAPPVASNDHYTLSKGDLPVFEVEAPGVLANDSDPDGDPLTASLVSGLDGLTLHSDGSFEYRFHRLLATSAPSNSATFTYQVSDGEGGTDKATVTFTIQLRRSSPLASLTAKAKGNSVQLQWREPKAQSGADLEVRHKGPEEKTYAPAETSLRPGREEGARPETQANSQSQAGEAKAQEGSQVYEATVSELKPGTHQFEVRLLGPKGEVLTSKKVEAIVRMDKALRLTAPAPNPVRREATLSFAVKEKSEARILLYNVLGQRVRTLYEGTLAAGESQTVRLDASDLPSGTYFLRLQASGQSKTRRLMIVR